MTNVYSFSRTMTKDEEDAFVRQEAVRSAHTALTHGTDGLRNFPIFLRECFELEVWKHDRTLAGGTRQGAVTFRDFIHQPYPTGLGASYEVIRDLIADDRTLLKLFDAAVERPAGNPTGVNQYSKGADSEGAGILYNVQDSSRHQTTAPSLSAPAQPEPAEPVLGPSGAASPPDTPATPLKAPTGNTAQAGIRRLRKAADDDTRAAELLRRVLDPADTLTVNGACVEMGWRQPTLTLRDDHAAITEAACKKGGPLETVKAAWRKASAEERTAIAAWIAEQSRAEGGI